MATLCLFFYLFPSLLSPLSPRTSSNFHVQQSVLLLLLSSLTVTQLLLLLLLVRVAAVLLLLSALCPAVSLFPQKCVGQEGVGEGSTSCKLSTWGAPFNLPRNIYFLLFFCGSAWRSQYTHTHIHTTPTHTHAQCPPVNRFMTFTYSASFTPPPPALSLPIFDCPHSLLLLLLLRGDVAIAAGMLLLCAFNANVSKLS